MRKFGRLALGAHRRCRSSQEIMGSPHIFARFRCLFLGYCHIDVLLLLSFQLEVL